MGHSPHFNAAEFSGYTVYCGVCAEGCGLYVLVVGVSVGYGLFVLCGGVYLCCSPLVTNCGVFGVCILVH